jgi:hypothetical protein
VEIANALQPANQSQADMSRRTRLLSGTPVQRGTPAPGTPIGELMRGAAMSSRVADTVRRLVEAEQENVGFPETFEASRKRPPDVQVEELQGDQSAFEARSRPGPAASEAAAPRLLAPHAHKVGEELLTNGNGQSRNNNGSS